MEREGRQTLKLERDDAVLNGYNVDVSPVGDQVRTHVLENQIDIFRGKLKLVGGGVESLGPTC